MPITLSAPIFSAWCSRSANARPTDTFHARASLSSELLPSDALPAPEMTRSRLYFCPGRPGSRKKHEILHYVKISRAISNPIKLPWRQMMTPKLFASISLYTTSEGNNCSFLFPEWSPSWLGWCMFLVGSE
jgi:hypothetical protein